MNRFIAGPTWRSNIVVRSPKSILLVWFKKILLLQLAAMTTASIVQFPEPQLHQYHHPHYYPSQGLHSPVRWTQPFQKRRLGRPVDVMTDVINDLGAKILDGYVDNTGNVAFSPSGLGFVLVALYEGSAGSSSREISDVLGLSHDRRITRIGLRDIHRRLRSYLDADAFLGGLTLNRDDINLRPDYEEILRFYGFDISDSSIENDPMTQNVSTNAPQPSMSIIPTMSPVSTASTDLADTAIVPSTTITPNPIDTTASNDVVEVITVITGGTNSAMSSSANAEPSPSAVTPTMAPQTDATADETGMDQANTGNPPVMIPMSIESGNVGTISSTEPSVTLNNDETVINGAETTPSPATVDTLPIRNLDLATNQSVSNQSRSPNVPTETPANPMITTMLDSVTSPMKTLVTSPMTSIIPGTTDNVANTDPTTIAMKNSTTSIIDETATNVVRKRRGILHGPGGYFSSSGDDGIWLDEIGRLNNHDDYPSQEEDIGVDSRRSTEVAFLVNGCEYSRVTAAVYTAILPFSYYSSLQASLLEFPLDDPRYKILVMLPSDENGTRRLAKLLATKPITLRRLRNSLEPTWVTAAIPSFMLRGFVTLTPYLQRLGISDVFDPRAADLTPMSPDLGVYARDIQQSIGVNIRNNVKGGIGGADGGNEGQKRQSQHRDDVARSVRGLHGLPPFFLAGGAISPRSHGNPHYRSYPGAGSALYGRGPAVPFVVDRPFLYFIVDDETSVTLLAGRIDDPLNTRML